jgi:hypothetical protein
MIAKIPLILWFYLILSLLLFVYSYGFLDYNLTLSSHPLFLRFVDPLQDLIYFNRPTSIRIYSILMFFLFATFLAILHYYHVRKITRFPWKPVLLVLTVFSLAYPMLSYDVFNYMFHGKILWFYHQNPHVHAPLEYSGDLWLRFMRWVHTPSAYGPVFTAVESPAYLLGFGKFVPVLYLMKLTMTGFFIWCIHLIGRIGTVIGLSKSKIIMSQLLLALNPFLLMDVVVNGHNDAVMMAFFLIALLYSLSRQPVKSLLSVIASIGTKYMTALTLPMYLFSSPKLKILFSYLALLLPVLIALHRFQPWYLVWAIIPAVLVDSRLVKTWIILASLAGLIFYVPYIATGFWLNTVGFVSLIVYLPIALALVLEFGLNRNVKNNQKLAN